MVKLFFSGVDWERKGGEIAFNTVVALNKRGINCELLISGISKLPESIAKSNFVKSYGYP
ncbi:hypothetical protein ACLUX0_10505 [Limosilactobacillus mucosae]